MELVEIPRELLPVLRRWREDRAGLSYLAGSHIIVLQEELPLAETVFVLCHEAVHSRLFNCALGFLLGSLSGFEAQFAHSGLKLSAVGLDESDIPEGHPRAGFYSRRPRRPRELSGFPPDLQAHVEALCQTERFQTLIRSYMTVRRRKSILLNEWRFPHEGLATLSELSILRELPRVREACARWAGVLGLEEDSSSFEASVRKRLEGFLRILDAPRNGLPTPDQLIAGRAEGLDPYVNGAGFLYHYCQNAPKGLDLMRVTQLASQIPYGILPGLDDPFERFLAVARDACSPTVRLGRIATALPAGLLRGTSAAEVLPFALGVGDRKAAEASSTQGYYSWEWKSLHSTKLMDPVLSLADKPDQLPYGLSRDQFLYNREPVANAGSVWVIYNDKAIPCDLDGGFGIVPRPYTDEEQDTLMTLLESQFIVQSFERLVENVVSWGGVREEDGSPLEWV